MKCRAHGFLLYAHRSYEFPNQRTSYVQDFGGKVFFFAEQNAVTDTLAALVYDIDATAEVLRKGSLKKKKKHEVWRKI